jgi:hypothetical protein
MRRWVLAVLALALALPTAGRRYHDDRKHRHAHTYLQLCTDGDGVHPQACVEKVDNNWPKPALLAPLKCVVPASGSDFRSVIDASAAFNADECDAAGHVSGGTRPSTHVIFAPITVPMGVNNKIAMQNATCNKIPNAPNAPARASSQAAKLSGRVVLG